MKVTEEFKGRNRFLVGRAVGGFMESPRTTYQDYRIIEARTKKQAELLYNNLFPEDMFKGYAVGGVEQGNLYFYDGKGLTVDMGVKLHKHKCKSVFMLYKYDLGNNGIYEECLMGVYLDFHDARVSAYELVEKLEKGGTELNEIDYSDDYQKNVVFESWNFDKTLTRIKLKEENVIEVFKY